MTLDSSGKVGIGGEPGTRTIDEAKALAKTKLTAWKAEVKKRTAEQPEASTQDITLEVTDGDFGVMPTADVLAEKLAERAIGGGNAKLQVAGDGFVGGMMLKDIGAISLLYKTASGGAGIMFHNDQIKPSDNTGTATNGVLSIGDPSYRFKDGHFSGTIYGKVADVADHIKAITPTQIANWDAGTGGGGGGANIDGRISDTQITHWDTAYGWGNHASAGYAKGSFVPTSGNTTISGTLTATDFIAQSDERLKKNVETADPSVVSQLRGVTFDWVDSGKASSGVIAQEVEKVLPHLVHDDGFSKAVNYNGLVAYLIEEVKSLRAELEAMK